MSEKEKPESSRFRYKFGDNWEVEVEGESGFVLSVYEEIKNKKTFPPWVG